MAHSPRVCTPGVITCQRSITDAGLNETYYWHIKNVDRTGIAALESNMDDENIFVIFKIVISGVQKHNVLWHEPGFRIKKRRKISKAERHANAAENFQNSRPALDKMTYFAVRMLLKYHTVMDSDDLRGTSLCDAPQSTFISF